MTLFSLLLPEAKLAIACLMFAAGMAQLILCIYKDNGTAKKYKLVPDCLILLAVTAATAYLTVSTPLNNKNGVTLDIPFAAVVAIALSVLIGALFRIIRERALNKRRLSPDSIRQALDNLNSGVFFSEPDGKIVLINHTMLKLAYELIGAYPQIADEIHFALEKPTQNCGVIKLDDSPALYMFNDKSVWRFNTQPLNEKGLDGFSQTTAQDVTEIYNANESLKAENESLRLTNHEMQQMYNRLADRIRDEEMLNLKIKVHDNIGASLIAITEILGGANDDMDSQLKKLDDAISYFSNDRPSPTDSFEQAVEKAAEMKVELVFEGEFPNDDVNGKIVVLAARESVTNCIHHAHGNKVVLKGTKSRDGYTLIITNNGEQPKEPIIEGSGLTSLRRRVEGADGIMKVEYSPEFMLKIILKDKE